MVAAVTSVVWIVLSFASFVLGQTGNDTKLLQVQMMYRHGARSPIMIYPNDPNSLESWPEGLGKLTQLGKKQHYILGKYLRTLYSGFVTSDPNEVLVNSTVYDRCLESAQSNLASFYAPTPEWAIDDSLNWQPIPVHYVNTSEDKYLSMESDCNRFYEEQSRRFSSPEFLDVVARYEDMIEAVGQFSGAPGWKGALFILDTMISERAHGLTLPSWIEPYWDELSEFCEFAFFWIFNSEVLHRLRAGPILGRIIDTMENKIAGNNPQLKVHVFSVHDINLIALMEALGVYNMKRPVFCATLLFELHEMSDGQKAVRLLYLNSTRPEVEESHVTHLLQLEGCSEFCPLDQFRALMMHLIPEDWDRECQTTDVAYKRTGSLAEIFGSNDDVKTSADPLVGSNCRPSTASNELVDSNCETTL